MNSLILISLAALACIAVAGPADYLQQVLNFSQSCSEKSGLSKEGQEKIKDPKVLPASEAEKCYLDCMFENMGLTKDGKPYVEGAKKMAAVRYGSDAASIEKAGVAIDYCDKNVKPSNEKCYMGFAIRDCVMKSGTGISLF